jgi:mRNA-degrading endonuclease RelE of RelBE toxin-antitoxin system
MYEIELSDSAGQDLKWFRKYEQKQILDAIYAQLRYEPTVKTRNRKPLEDSPTGMWELRVGDARVFYQVDAVVRIVSIEAIGEKRGNRLYFRGREGTL